jgi:hypothetical protein
VSIWCPAKPLSSIELRTHRARVLRASQTIVECFVLRSARREAHDASPITRNVVGCRAQVVSSVMRLGPKTAGLPVPAGEATRCACPACGVALSAGATPPQSIVICATCCTTLLWNGAFSVATRAQIEALSPRDQARLFALAEAQRARLAHRFN